MLLERSRPQGLNPIICNDVDSWVQYEVKIAIRHIHGWFDSCGLHFIQTLNQNPLRN